MKTFKMFLENREEQELQLEADRFKGYAEQLRIIADELQNDH